MEAIDETTRTAEVEREDIARALVALHNLGTIDMLVAFSELRKSEAGYKGLLQAKTGPRHYQSHAGIKRPVTSHINRRMRARYAALPRRNTAAYEGKRCRYAVTFTCLLLYTFFHNKITK